MQERSIHQLLNTLPQVGRIEWIGLRPSRGEPMLEVEEARAESKHGLEGDRFKGRPGSKRQVTLLQYEHIAVIAASLHREMIEPSELRRNIVVSGINLLAFKDKTFHLGEELVLGYTGLCHPCSKMERHLGAGGYNAMRGHGGITARVIDAGLIRRGDAVFYRHENRGFE